MTDNRERLNAECERLRKLAHEAPFAEFSMDHRGHTAIVNHTSAWARAGDDWIKACAKRDALSRPDDGDGGSSQPGGESNEHSSSK